MYSTPIYMYHSHVFAKNRRLSPSGNISFDEKAVEVNMQELAVIVTLIPQYSELQDIFH
jgi:hypothetical protein